MLDVIFAIKFVHMVAMAVMFGTWTCNVLFMLLAHSSGNAFVVALISRFVVRAELTLMAAAVALQPLAGYPLAGVIGDRFDEYWLEVSVAIYAALVAVWAANLVIELRIRTVSHEAAVSGKTLPESYRRLFFVWSGMSVAGLTGMVLIMALMIWQPHWY